MLRGTWETNYRALLTSRLQDYHFLWSLVPEQFSLISYSTRQNHLSDTYPHYSYVATRDCLHNISFGYSRFAHHYSGNHFVFFSWHYLDVSVHAVILFALCIQTKMPEVCSGGLPHSDTLGSKLGWQLPEAFSSLPLPSSPPNTSGIHQKPFSITYKSLIAA